MTVNDRILGFFKENPDQSFRVCDIQERLGLYARRSIKVAIKILAKNNPKLTKIVEGNRGSAAHSDVWSYITK